MALINDMPQVLGIAGLQLKLILRKRFILVLVTLWLVHVVITVQLGRAGGAVLLMLIPSLYISDLLAVVMACGLIADDADHGTFPFVLSHAIDRSMFLIGKLLPVVALTLAFSTLAHTATVSMMSFPAGTSLAVPAARVVMASGMSLVRILVVTAVTAYMAVAFTNRVYAAVGALLFAYGLPYLFHALLSPHSPGVWLAESFLPWRDSFDRTTTGLFSGGIAAGTVAAAVAQPLVYAVFFAAIALHTLRRRDLVGGGS